MKSKILTNVSACVFIAENFNNDEVSSRTVFSQSAEMTGWAALFVLT